MEDFLKRLESVLLSLNLSNSEEVIQGVHLMNLMTKTLEVKERLDSMRTGVTENLIEEWERSVDIKGYEEAGLYEALAGKAITYFEVPNNDTDNLTSSYSEADLISFGKYLLSYNRKLSILGSPIKGLQEDVLAEVYHADIENWKDSKEEVKNIPPESMTTTNNEYMLILKGENKPEHISWADILQALRDFKVIKL